MTEAGAEFDAAAGRLSEYTTRAVPWLWEVRGLDEFVTIARAQVPPAVDLVGKMLRANADAVIAGAAPATLPLPENVTEPVANAGANVASDPGLAEANFTVVDRGPARVLKVHS